MEGTDKDYCTRLINHPALLENLGSFQVFSDPTESKFYTSNSFHTRTNLKENKRGAELSVGTAEWFAFFQFLPAHNCKFYRTNFSRIFPHKLVPQKFFNPSPKFIVMTYRFFTRWNNRQADRTCTVYSRKLGRNT